MMMVWALYGLTVTKILVVSFFFINMHVNLRYNYGVAREGSMAIGHDEKEYYIFLWASYYIYCGSRALGIKCMMGADFLFRIKSVIYFVVDAKA